VAESIKFEGRLWAVVTAASGRRFIGEVVTVTEDEESEVIKFMRLDPAYEITTLMRPVPTGPRPDEMAIQRQTLVFPVDACAYDCSVQLSYPSEVHFADDFHENDRRMFIDQIRMVRAQMVEGRGQKLGLAKPPPGFDPTKFKGS
jgi:hypothetical protein